MSALLSTFKSQFEEDPQRPDSAPAMDYIVGSFLDSIENRNISNLQHEAYQFDNSRSNSVPLERMGYMWKEQSMMPTPSSSPLPMLEDRRFSEFTQYDGSSQMSADAHHHLNMINRRMSNNTSQSASPAILMENLPVPAHDNYFFQEFKSTGNHNYFMHDHNSADIGSKFVSYQHPSQLSSGQKQRAFQCDFPNCTKEFQKRNSLEQHRNIHLGKQKEKPFQCDKCPQAFARSHGIIIAKIRFKKALLHSYKE